MRLSWNEIRVRAGGFTHGRELVEYLFGLYERMVAPLEAEMKGKSGQRSGRRPARGKARR